MSDKANWVGTTEVDEGNVQHTGTHRFDGGNKFVIVDQTDSTKSVIFNLSGLPTGTQTEFTVPDSDSSLVTLTATQTLTNKTLTAPVINGGTIAATDSTFTIADNATPTKIATFQCSGLTAGTNVFTFPNTAADTLVTLAATQTMTAKTLTDPTIGGTVGGSATYTTPTLTNPVVNAGSGTVVLPGANPPAQTAEGSAVWDTSNDLLTVGTGAARKTMVDTDSNQTMTGKTLTNPTITEGTYSRINQQYQTSAAGNAKAGATAGWVVAAAANTALVTLPASQTGSTLVIPITGLKVGWIITGFYYTGQIESGGNAVDIAADLRVMTAIAADFSDASVATAPTLNVTADTLISSANTNVTGLTEVVTGVKNYYLLVTATTLADTDIALSSVTITCTTN